MLNTHSRLGSGHGLLRALAACALGLGVFADASQPTVVTYTYDDAGRLIVVYSNASNAGSKTTYSLDPAGNRKLVATVGTPVITAFAAAAASASSITLTWTVTDTGGPGGLTYSVKRSSTQLSCTSSPCTDTGLAANTSYSYTLTATDSGGNAATASASATTYTLPVVTAFTATVASDTAINLSWSATDSGGPGIANYKLYRGSTLLTTTTATSYSDTGLSAGTAYSYTVYADDSAGDAGSASASATTYTVPVVASFTATVASDSGINLSWTATDSGGPGITNYKLYRGSTLVTTTTATSYSDTGLSTGTAYTYTVYADDTAGDAGSRTASATTYTVPVVASLTATVASDSGINLSWSGTDSGGPGIANYKLYRGSTLLTTTTATSYSDTGLSAGTAYSYTVYADDTVGDAGSASASATTYTVPVVATFTATTASTSTINLSWSVTDSGGPGITNYKLYRGSTLLTTTSSTSYSDTGLSAGTAYSYTVYADDSAGDAGSASASATTYTVPVVASFTATAASTSSINLGWSGTDSGGPGIANYKLYRGSTLLTTTSSTSYSDTGLSAGTAYSYTVYADDTVGDAGSASASATTYTVPVVTSFTATTASTSGINLSWSATDSGGPGIANYKLYRGSTLLTTTTATSYSDTGLAAGTAYSYTVYANDSAGDAGSASASATTYTAPVVTSFTATTASDSGINLSWSATDSGGPGIANYKLYRGSTLLTTTTATSYSDTGLSAGTAYSYTVYADDSVGDAGSSSTSATTYTVPVVSSFTATTASPSAINLSWSGTDSGGPGIANYKLYRGSTLLTTTTATSYSDTGLSAGTTYTYTLYAVDTAGDAGSASASAQTLPAAPTLSLSPTSTYSGYTFSVYWTTPAGTLNHFTLSRQVNSGTPALTTYPASTTSIQDSGVAPRTTTYLTYQVRACVSSDESACSVWSNSAVETVLTGCPPGGCLAPPPAPVK